VRTETRLADTIDLVCQECGISYRAPRLSIGCSKYCSAICRERAYLKTRKGAAIRSRERFKYRTGKKNNTIDLIVPYVVYERDNWKCHLCGKRIGKKHKNPHPLSASIDHIIPISKGGEHSYKNVKASHLKCNASKCNRTIDKGEQLLLIGL